MIKVELLRNCCLYASDQVNAGNEDFIGEIFLSEIIRGGLVFAEEVD